MIELTKVINKIPKVISLIRINNKDGNYLVLMVITIFKEIVVNKIKNGVIKMGLFLGISTKYSPNK